jgi:hypothetical protein
LFWLEIVSLVRVDLSFSFSLYIVSSYQIHCLRILGARSVWEERNCWKELDNIKASSCIFLPHSLIHICFSFLYEYYLFILYDSLITYIVSYQRICYSCLHWFMFLCRYFSISLMMELGSHWRSQIFNI